MVITFVPIRSKKVIFNSTPAVSFAFESRLVRERPWHGRCDQLNSFLKICCSAERSGSQEAGGMYAH